MILAGKEKGQGFFRLSIDSRSAFKGAWIDLNEDGVKQANEAINTQGNPQEFVTDANYVIIYGPVSELRCDKGNFTILDVSENPYLTHLKFTHNRLQVLRLNNKELHTLDVSYNELVLRCRCYNVIIIIYL